MGLIRLSALPCVHSQLPSHRIPSPTDKLGPYSLVSALGVCLDAAKGMVYLHSADLIHRDLKSMNIMISEGMRGKVADYGESREKTTDMTMTATGTPLWMAPEVSCSTRYDSQADVYSFGVILYEVLKCDLPYSDRKDASGIGLAVAVALKGLRPTIEDDWHPKLKSLLKDCYELVPSDRPTFSQVVLRLTSVIDDMADDGDQPKAAGGPGAERGAKAVESNLLGLDLWRTIKADPTEMSQGARIGGVCILLCAVVLPTSTHRRGATATTDRAPRLTCTRACSRERPSPSSSSASWRRERLVGRSSSSLSCGTPTSSGS